MMKIYVMSMILPQERGLKTLYCLTVNSCQFQSRKNDWVCHKIVYQFLGRNYFSNLQFGQIALAETHLYLVLDFTSLKQISHLLRNLEEDTDV